jgi:hypothetical protein
VKVQELLEVERTLGKGKLGALEKQEEKGREGRSGRNL